MPLLSLQLPAPVYMVLLHVVKVDSFEVVPPDDVIAKVFFDGFSDTSAVNSGWVNMDSDSKIAISNLGNIFFLTVWIALLILVSFLLHALGRYFVKVKPICKKLQASLFYG
jgi:hypothetical protein